MVGCGYRLRVAVSGPAWPAGLARRRPVRLRLTLIYTGLFLLAAAMLVAVSYVFLVRELSPRPASCASRASR